MILLFRNLALASSALVIAGCSTMGGMGGSSDSQSTVAEQAELAGNAQSVLEQQMSQADAKRIPSQLVANARCIAVFPSVIQAGVIVGGSHGKGLVTCRQQAGGFKSADPAVYSISAGSIGLQAGAQKSSVILLFNSKKSVNALLQSKIKLGSQISVTAGPSGYNHPIGNESAPVVAYATSQKGLYAGIDLSGTKMSFSQSANTSLYDASATPRGVLLGDMQPASAMDSFKQTLQQFAPTASQNSGGNQKQKQKQKQQSDSNKSEHNEGKKQPDTNQSQTSGSQGQSQQQSGSQQSQPQTQSNQSNTGQ